MYRLLYPFYWIVKILEWFLYILSEFFDWLWEWNATAEHELRFQIDRAKGKKVGRIIMKAKSSLPFPFKKFKV